jgi:hypothetical protein
MSKEWKVLGINSDETVCDVCGKENLKRVVWLQSSETGETVKAGTTCAALLQKITVKQEIKQEKEWFESQRKKIFEKFRSSHEYKEFQNKKEDWEILSAKNEIAKLPPLSYKEKKEFFKKEYDNFEKLIEKMKKEYNLKYLHDSLITFNLE